MHWLCILLLVSLSAHPAAHKYIVTCNNERCIKTATAEHRHGRLGRRCLVPAPPAPCLLLNNLPSLRPCPHPCRPALIPSPLWLAPPSNPAHDTRQTQARPCLYSL